MIEILTRQLNPILSSLPWVGKYGGVIRPLTMTFEGEEGALVEKTFPISADYNSPEDCTGDFYMDLVPDSEKGAVLYWEATGDVTREGYADIGKRRNVLFTGNLRLVGWVNLLKLGLLNEFGAVDVLTAGLIKEIEQLNGKHFTYKGLFFRRVKWTFQGFQNKDQNIFGNYSYDDPGLLTYPYDYFAMLWNVSFILPLECITAYYTEFVEGCWDPVYAGRQLADLDSTANAPVYMEDLDGNILIDFE